jgi:hypothetical protein
VNENAPSLKNEGHFFKNVKKSAAQLKKQFLNNKKSPSFSTWA